MVGGIFTSTKRVHPDGHESTHVTIGAQDGGPFIDKEVIPPIADLAAANPEVTPKLSVVPVIDPASPDLAFEVLQALCALGLVRSLGS